MISVPVSAYGTSGTQTDPASFTLGRASCTGATGVALDLKAGERLHDVELATTNCVIGLPG